MIGGGQGNPPPRSTDTGGVNANDALRGIGADGVTGPRRVAFPRFEDGGAPIRLGGTLE